MITVRSFLASPESFAPYNYVCKYTTNLHERYAELTKHLGFQDNLDTPIFGWLNIHICEQDHCKKYLDIRDVISTTGYKSIDGKGQNKYKTFGTFLESKEGLKLTYPSLVVINECCSELRDEITAHKDSYNSILFIIIADENSEKQPESKCQVQKRTDSIILVSSRGKVNDDIGDELERIVLKAIKPKCENVNKWLNEKKCLIVNKMATGGSRKAGSFVEASSKIKVIHRPRFSMNVKENDKHYHSSHTSISFNGNVSVNTKDKILQMNDKSKDPDRHHSFYVQQRQLHTVNGKTVINRQVSKNAATKSAQALLLKRELFDISSVRGVGYRFTCFVVYVERGEETELQQQKIRSVLKDNDIDDYEIQSVPEQRNYCRVGNKIRATQICQGRDKPVVGTLGCLANYKSGRDTNMCALISMHVARFCDSFYISSSSASGLLGTRITASVTETGLDIAALQLVLNDKNIKICAKFKTEIVDNGSVSGSAVGGDGFDLLQGKLHHYSDHLDHNQTDMLCNGQKVYIWGAVSKPGKGVITMRAYQHDGMKSLIQIEDRVPSKVGEIPERFCSAGDSGAIVCAEDSRCRFVHILAMLIGIINEKEIENNPKIKGKYLTVPLSSGLEELKERTGFTFQICECIDS